MIVTKKTKQINLTESADGFVLLFDKGKSKTSFDVIREIRRKFGIKKVGHAGTLDPMATGLLIVCVGKKTKEIFKFQDMEKTYTGTITLGASTPSMDAETELINVRSINDVSIDKINKVKNSYIGEIEQVPPMFSAIKHKGKALYKYARKGVEVERQPRKVNINSFLIHQIVLPNVDFEIGCSKGTYIRVIANDFGETLGCGGYLTKLRRTAIGPYKVEDALTIEELNKIEIIDSGSV
ncbi:MAG: tRNA pseudouridine(55) synthase TruB [Ignavibacteriales bacterium]|nr:tRNA pseudouridine(55) synthase TruB [Ignavibacteriales bacterium]